MEPKRAGLLKEGVLLADRYTITGYLASGGFGNTYKASHRLFKNNKTFAIKELYIRGMCERDNNTSFVSISNKDNYDQFEAYKKKFQHEAVRMANLKNDHIVEVTDYFEEKGTVFYAMEYIAGESLSQRMKRKNMPFSQEEVLDKILPQLLDALEYIHTLEEPIYHLDLKPANIMIDGQGNVKLIDFGASKQISHSGESSSSSSGVAYTMGYAPPEQLEGDKKKFGAYTDIYSLGATLYNILTNQQPPKTSAINEEGSENAIKMPDSLIKRLIMWMMKTSRRERPQSIAEIRKFLEEFEGIQDAEASDDVDTVIKNNPEEEIDEKIPTIWQKKLNQFKKVGYYVVFLALGFLCVLLVDKLRTKTKSDIPDQVIKEIQVTDTLVNVTDGPENMRKYLYTGAMVDTIGALPNGPGIAKFEKYKDVPAATYNGLFVNGVCNDTTGNASLSYDSGDKFIGKIIDGIISDGTYYMPDQSYFKGTFKDGQPLNGTWYNADNSFNANVVNGMESFN